MSHPYWENLKAIFHAAIALAPGERRAYLERVCNGDLALRRAVESLLKSHEETGFVDQPAYQAAADMLVEHGKLTAGQTLGRYRIVSLIGEGGMGQVYLAEDTKLHRKLSLKFLSTNVTQDHERLRRFEQESHATSALNHPNIITIYEIGEEDGHQFIATEFIEGQTLRERLRSPLDLDESLEVAIQVASALVAAHRVNIVHRDIKPENIMIRKDDGLVKVLDFGLAKMSVPLRATIDLNADTQLRNTAPGVVMGTMAYMSPEQARGDTVDERTDIWSLGVVIYEMIAGCSPFVASTSNEIISAILSKEAPAPLTRYSQVVPERLEEIVEKALAKNKDERYQTSKDLLIDLKRLQQTLQLKAISERSTSPVPVISEGQANVASSQPRPAFTQSASSAEYIVNQVKSHKRAALTGLVALLLIVVAAVTYSWRIRRSAAPEQPEIKSLAVLPLRSLDTNDNYLGLGIADAVIRRISQTGKVIVRPTSAVRRYLNEEVDALTAARQLNADAVLEGSVQRADERLRVSVNLLRAANGASLWADSFDMGASDIFSIQDTVAQQVVSRLRLRLNSEQQARFAKHYTSNPEAYEYYVKGRYSQDRARSSLSTPTAEKEEFRTAIAMFKRTIEIDPQYALAHAQLAYCYVFMALFVDEDNPVWLNLTKQALSQAEALDPDLAEAHMVRAQIYWSRHEGWKMAEAVRELRLAHELNPAADPAELGVLYAHIGLEDQSTRELQRAMEIDPTSEVPRSRLVESYELFCKPDEAITAQQKFYNVAGPTLALLWKNRLDEAQPLIERALARDRASVRALSLRARLSALRGKYQQAEAMIPSIIELAKNDRGYHHVTYNIASVYALAGKTDEAVKWLRTTAETGMPNYPLFARDPHLNRIRKETAFIEFMGELQPRWEGLKKEFE